MGNLRLVSVVVLVALIGICRTDGAELRTVKTTVFIPASPERVLRSFVNADDLRGWWKASRSLAEAKPGGIWSVTWS
jgi:uncharacterized protein YndB with AHSA1/START domain